MDPLGFVFTPFISMLLRTELTEHLLSDDFHVADLLGTFIMCSQLALLKNDFELALMYSEIVLWPTDSTGWSAGRSCGK